AVEATLKAWRKSSSVFEVYNVGGEDWVSVNEIAEVIVEVLGLSDVKRVYKPVLHGIGWLGDVKHIALSIDRLKSLGWRPKMNSRQAISEAAKSILQEIKGAARF
ncbi:MAG: UDP-glucose 4-epimerase, partial [Candidatus Bathyarchaeota archaeon]|nr:UDP-glucose 4-epimerase [Candidatus Bathyarchaeota archaeon]